MNVTSRDPLVGSRIREYEILEVIGKGGMGAVYRARHIYLEEERAIKVIHSRLASDQAFVDRFLREARILSRLQHPNLVQLFEYGMLNDSAPFMVMELIRGESVLDRIRRMKRIPLGESIRIIRQAAMGLHSAHQQGIVHRDISPDNLLIVKTPGGDERIKIIDFGIAKPLFETTRDGATNTFVGKTEYCSPEQCGLLEESEIIDRRSDIYSLGVTFYQVLSGKLPFYASTPQGYLLKHATENPEPPATHFEPGKFPEALNSIVLKMLAKKRGERYASMEELVDDLDAIDVGNVTEQQRTPRRREMPLSPSDLHIGDLFARRYLVERKIGEGGMAVVYKARDNLLEVPVALKLIKENIVTNEQSVERLKREVVLARKVSHPNACRIYDMGEDAGRHYVSMEYLEGETLGEILDRDGRLTPEVGLPVIRQVLLALNEAHHAGVIHRDLKPENIMVDANQKGIIMDFGISISPATPRITQVGTRIGSSEYMSPEQVAGHVADERSDLYSIGVILFETLTGELPIETSGEIRKPSEIAPDLPQKLDSIVLKALHTDPNNRHQTVRDLLADLEPLIHPTTTSLHLRKPQSYRLIQAATLVIVALVILGYIAFHFIVPAQQSSFLPIPVAASSVSINALPWARVTVRSQDSRTTHAEQTSTPCAFLLQPGKYRLALSNDGITAPLEETIVIYAGKPASFVFTMPGYSPAKIAAEVQSQP